MNYMDYTDDDSMFMFTNGQIVRMQACLDGDRSTIGHTKSGPTLIIADQGPVTGIAADFPTIAQNDIHPTAAFADVNPTLAAADFPTIAASDQPTLAVLDHVGPTMAVSDFPTLAIRDTPLPTVAFRDVAGPGGPGPIGDPQPFPGGIGGFGGIGGGAGRHVPFVLSTPHHTMAWRQSFPDMAQQQIQQLAAQIAQYEQVLGQFAAADAAGTLSAVDATRADQITADYMALVAEYRQLTGG